MTDPILTDHDGGPLYKVVLGRAGTGKSFMARQKAEEDPSNVLAATTGIAATNLGAGTTINSLLWYEKTEDLEDNYRTGRLLYRLTKLMKAGVRRILLDEFSMLSGQQLDLICHGLDEANGTYFYEGATRLGLTLIGDACQLPPIDRERKPKYAFEADSWDRFAPNITHLTTMYRQDDADFIEALRLVRLGDGAGALPFFEPLIKDAIDHHFDGTTAMPHNLDVNRMNQIYLDGITSPYIVFKSHLWGERSKDWNNIPDKLYLKLGALVMILNNQKHAGYDPSAVMLGESPFLYVNGDLGTLVDAEVENNVAYVKLHRTRETVAVGVHKREHRAVVEDPKTKRMHRALVGTLHHVPIRIAHASTFHKLQGLTLDSVQVEFKKRFCGMPGMMYVALSRARTAKGLRLVGSSRLFTSRCCTDPRLRDWI